ncbi:MAG: PorP/SprF family type IX secretion system membrane protein [Sphingobacteriales bacterium]|nr:MAG: PorP/SprF family type IX secretion system membrane protein [Sphingobacteriales bacterium]
MKLKWCFLIVLLSLSCIFPSKGWAQDPEFSQFYAAPAHLNPSMIGFSWDPRIALNYRHQYPQFGNAYLTFAASYDQHFDNLNSSFGLSVMADRAGEGGIYNTYQVNGLYAYQLRFSSDLQVKVGAQIGYFNQSLDWSKLVFTDMIDPTNGSTGGTTSELTPEQTSIHRLDIGGGIVAYNSKFYIGASAKHVTTPSLAFTNSNDEDNDLKVRASVHAGRVFYLGQKVVGETQFYISPNLMFINQGRHFQVNAGSYLGKGIFFGGIFMRHTIRNMDALILLAGIKAGIVRFGYSYDINIGPLSTGAGAHEVAAIIDFGQKKGANDKIRRKKAAECPEIFSPR